MKLFSQFFSRFFSQFFSQFFTILKLIFLESYWRYHTRGSVWIDDDGSHCNSYKWPTLKKSFATEKTLALISEIFWNSEHFFILYCTVMSKIFILNLHMLVMHRPSLSEGISSSAPSRDTNEIYLLLFIPVPNENVATRTPKKIITNKTKWT